MRRRTIAPVVLAAALGVSVSGALAQSEGSPKSRILEIVDSRALRLPELDAFKSIGVVGENNRGLVEIVDPAKLDELDDPGAKAKCEVLVRDENADRENLYAALASDGNEAGGDAAGDAAARLQAIRDKYAEIMRKDALPGVWIQLPNGSWKRKDDETG